MKFENLKVKEMFIDIDEVLNISKVSKKDFIDYLKSRRKEKILIIESYEEKKATLASKEISELRYKVDLMISKVKRGDKNLKIKSLEERFLNQKNIILSNLESQLEFYKEGTKILNNKLNEIEKNEIYASYFFVKGTQENEVAFVFPIKIENENGNIYVRNDLEKEVLSNKKIFRNMKLEEIKISDIVESLSNAHSEVIQKIAFLNVEVKTKSVLENLLESQEMSKRMKNIINQEKYNKSNSFKNNISSLKTSDEDIIQIVTQKKDFLLVGEKYKEKILEIVENLLLNDEKVLIVSKDESLMKEKIKQFISKSKSDNKIKKLDNYNLIENIKQIKSLIKKNIKVENIMNMNTEFGLDVKKMCDVVKDYDLYNNEQYIKYKKNLNLDGITYDELNNSIKNIEVEDIEKYKTYRLYKDRFITFNEYPYSYDELSNIKNVIQKIEVIAQKKCTENKNYFKKIAFKIKNKGTILGIEDLREIGRECAREKNRELLIEDKNMWSIKNIFSGVKQKERRREELELFKKKEIQEIKEVIDFYKSLDENYTILEKIDKLVFKDIISILSKDNYSEEISKKIKSIEFSLKNKDILSSINSWDNLKIALVDYLYKSKSLKESKTELIIFKISDELLKISTNYEINIIKEFKEYSEKNIEKLVVQSEKLFAEYIRRKYDSGQNLYIYNFSEIQKLKLKEAMYNTVVILNYKVKIDEDEILPLIYRGERCLSFREKSDSNKYEINFTKLQ
ncbi:MAG: hypothetical protein ACRCTZ_12195 [Sarcina sp.]